MYIHNNLHTVTSSLAPRLGSALYELSRKAVLKKTHYFQGRYIQHCDTWRCVLCMYMYVCACRYFRCLLTALVCITFKRITRQRLWSCTYIHTDAAPLRYQFNAIFFCLVIPAWTNIYYIFWPDGGVAQWSSPLPLEQKTVGSNLLQGVAFRILFHRSFAAYEKRAKSLCLFLRAEQ
jgi:hypothetical protein